MIIYNTTFSIPKELQNEFLDFIRDEYIPLSTKNNLIKEPRLTRVFSKDDDEDYSLLLNLKPIQLNSWKWNKMYGRKLYFCNEKIQTNILGFTTLLQPIEL